MDQKLNILYNRYSFNDLTKLYFELQSELSITFIVDSLCFRFFLFSFRSIKKQSLQKFPPYFMMLTL